MLKTEPEYWYSYIWFFSFVLLIHYQEEEKVRVAESKAQLQQQVKESGRRNEELIHVTGRLQDSHAKLELALADLDRSRSLNEKLKDQLAKVFYTYTD